MIGSNLASSLQSLHPFRSGNSSSRGPTTRSGRSSSSAASTGSITDPFNSITTLDMQGNSMETSQASSYMDSESESELPANPPPSYDEVVSDTSYVPSDDTYVFHQEHSMDRRTRRRHAASPSRLVEYGLDSSKIYMSAD